MAIGAHDDRVLSGFQGGKGDGRRRCSLAMSSGGDESRGGGLIGRSYKGRRAAANLDRGHSSVVPVALKNYVAVSMVCSRIGQSTTATLTDVALSTIESDCFAGEIIANLLAFPSKP